VTDNDMRADRIRRVLSRLRRPTGSCLSDQVAIGYALDTLSPAALARADTHLARCERCAAEMARLVEEGAAWQGAEGERRLAEFRLRVREAMRSRHAPLQVEIRNVALSAEALDQPSLAAGQVGPIRYRGLEDRDRNLVLSFEAQGLNLIGRHLRLTAARFSRNVVLQQVGPDAVGADATISRVERAEWPVNTNLSIEVVEPDPPA
jgi:hypothetical protein